MLNCECDFDADPSDYAWIYYKPSDFTVFDGNRRKRCCSCKQLINKKSVALEFSRVRATRGDIEEKIYGDGVIPLSSYWMCERCGEIFLNLSELKFCVNIDASMEDHLKEYHAITGFEIKEAQNAE